ncbi:MAG TPA: excinuclease ABC subunit UvrC [Nitrospiria bacterium]|nr:excinuclease ABC subunit UvrC [Nitrospiria bacterium]
MASIILDKNRDPAGQLPKSPGVYLMKDRTGAVLYVGKAKRLTDRVRSYFQQGADHPPKTARMVTQIAAIDYIVTGSELEALILENNLIKKHRPRFNVILRDDKNYPFLRLPMKEDYPRLEIVRRVKPDGALYFGPYVPTHSLRETLRWLRRIFPLPNCTITIDGTAERPCVEFEIKRCLAPCTGHQSQADYKAMINQVRLFLEGRETELQDALRERMEAESARLNFEEAARIRDQIAHIEAILEKQRITSTKLEDQDVWAIVRGDGDNECRGGLQTALTFVIQLLFIRAGMIVGRKEFYLHEPADSEPAALLTSAIEHYYSRETVIPPEIVVSMALPDSALLTEWLGQRRGGPVTFRVPQRGHDRDLVRLAEENGRAALAARDAVAKKETEAAVRLQQLLGLGRVPRRIDAFDISNLAADQAVGACVVWVDEQFRPEEYRHIRMTQTAGPNDFGMMAELVHRRYARAIGSAGAGEAAPRPESIVPDLIVIDGGKGQLSAAVNVLQQLSLGETDVIGLAKAKGEKFERVFLPDESEPIVLSPGHPATHLLQRIRDEAHRFAISYHRKLRGKALVVSVLDDIPGLGKARKMLLLRRFGSLAKLRAASREEIEAVKGIPSGLARLIVEKLKGGSAT